MPTIAEIIAAKKAKEAAAAGKVSIDTTAPASTASSAPRETIAERVELNAAIDRIDPPGKHKAAATAREMASKTLGLVLSKDMPCAPNGEPRGQATPILGPDEADRRLSEPVTPRPSLPNHAAWNAVLGCTEADLCLVRDPEDPETAWLAVRHKECEHPPILILRLPWLLWEHPETKRAENEPF